MVYVNLREEVLNETNQTRDRKKSKNFGFIDLSGNLKDEKQSISLRRNNAIQEERILQFQSERNARNTMLSPRSRFNEPLPEERKSSGSRLNNYFNTKLDNLNVQSLADMSNLSYSRVQDDNKSQPSKRLQHRYY